MYLFVILGTFVLSNLVLTKSVHFKKIADIILKMTPILKEMRIAQLGS